MEVTPPDRFYLTTYSDTVPGFDEKTWSLQIDGLVERTIRLDYGQLKALPAVEVMRTLECIGNQVGGGLISNGTWRGVSLKTLLEQAGYKPEAKFLIMDGADDYFTSVPLELGLTDQSLLAYELDGKPLGPEHGWPLRALLPGVYGQKQPKWLQHIQVAAKSEKGPWEKKGWSDVATINPNSRIDRPPDGTVLSGHAGDRFTITGVAFTGVAGAARVEVSTDGGKNWSEATITRAPAPFTNYVWTEWGYDWPLPGSGEYLLMARVTDGAGNTQTAPGGIFTGTFPDGTSAIHSVPVRVQIT